MGAGGPSHHSFTGLTIRNSTPFSVNGKMYVKIKDSEDVLKKGFNVGQDP